MVCLSTIRARIQDFANAPPQWPGGREILSIRKNLDLPCIDPAKGYLSIQLQYHSELLDLSDLFRRPWTIAR